MGKLEEKIKEWLHMKEVKRYCKSINKDCSQCKYYVNNHDWCILVNDVTPNSKK